MASTRDATEILISADSHVGETTALRDRLPEAFRDRMKLLVPSADDDFTVVMGDTCVERPRRKPSAADRELELYGFDIEYLAGNPL